MKLTKTTLVMRVQKKLCYWAYTSIKQTSEIQDPWIRALFNIICQILIQILLLQNGNNFINCFLLVTSYYKFLILLRWVLISAVLYQSFKNKITSLKLLISYSLQLSEMQDFKIHEGSFRNFVPILILNACIYRNLQYDNTEIQILQTHIIIRSLWSNQRALRFHALIRKVHVKSF